MKLLVIIFFSMLSFRSDADVKTDGSISSAYSSVTIESGVKFYPSSSCYDLENTSAGENLSCHLGNSKLWKNTAGGFRRRPGGHYALRVKKITKGKIVTEDGVFFDHTIEEIETYKGGYQAAARGQDILALNKCIALLERLSFQKCE